MLECWPQIECETGVEPYSLDKAEVRPPVAWAEEMQDQDSEIFPTTLIQAL